MKLYHKIEPIWRFDGDLKKHIKGEYSNDLVELLKEHLWTFTEKVDGTNFRIIWDGYNLTYGGRTHKSQFSKMQIDFIETHLVNEAQEHLFEQKFGDKVCIVYGELYGVKIQKGGHLYTDNKGLAFKVFDIEINDIFLTYGSMVELSKELGYDFVPLALVGTIEEGLSFIKNNKTSLFSLAKLEGLVGKPVGDFRDRLGKRIVIKLKERDL